MTTTAPPPTITDPTEAARFLNRYARSYHAGAFATPTAKELASNPASIISGPGWVAVGKTLTRDSKRHDYAGRTITIPKGSRIITHLAAEPGARLDGLDLPRWDVVSTYVEDANVTRQMEEAGRSVSFTRVTAAAELIAAWTRVPSPDVPFWDQRTVARLPLDVPAHDRTAVLEELSGLHGWFDDYPFYSDGTWGALNLRGFWPDDPTRGVKPAEMSKTWKADHPADLDRRCDWTTLADDMPMTRLLATYAARTLSGSAHGMERVRLLRMAGNNGKGGELGRHTDITDKASGTRDGQIVRFHLPLVTDPRIKMTAWSLGGQPHAVHLPAWSLWYLDARKPHAVSNPTGVDRVHLVIDLKANDQVRRALMDAEEHAG